MDFWKTAEWLEYLLNSEWMDIIDHSFFIDGHLVPLIEKKRELYSPGFDDDKEILEKINEIATKRYIKRIQVDSEIKSYLNISTYNIILDLNNIKPTKGHRSAVKKAEQYLTYKISNDIGSFKKDYFKIAGKQTRPNKTFEILGEWIEKGNGLLLKARFGSATAGYVYILHHRYSAYYFMSATFEEYKKYNVNHFLLWKAFQILKIRGIDQIDLGEQVYNSLYYQPTEKEVNISRFKKGFGGKVVLKPKSEYFFNKDCFKKTMEERISNYIRSEL